MFPCKIDLLLHICESATWGFIHSVMINFVTISSLQYAIFNNIDISCDVIHGNIYFYVELRRVVDSFRVVLVREFKHFGVICNKIYNYVLNKTHR